MIDYVTDSGSQKLDINSLIKYEILHVENIWLLGGYLRPLIINYTHQLSPGNQKAFPISGTSFSHFYILGSNRKPNRVIVALKRVSVYATCSMVD